MNFTHPVLLLFVVWSTLHVFADINDCQTGEGLCAIHADCTDTHGSYTCTCRDGYIGDGRSCTDIDECLVQTTCGINAICTNTDGSYTCTYLDGYSEDGRTCADIPLKTTVEDTVTILLAVTTTISVLVVIILVIVIIIMRSMLAESKGNVFDMRRDDENQATSV